MDKKLAGIPQSIFDKIIKDWDKIVENTIKFDVKLFPYKTPTSSMEQILPLTICFFKIFFLCALEQNDLHFLENIIKNSKAETFNYDSTTSDDFTRELADLQPRPVPEDYEMVSNTIFDNIDFRICRTFLVPDNIKL